MKQFLFTVLLSFLFITLFAQTGMFGISFNQSFTDAQKVLKDKGFVETEKVIGKAVYTNSKIKGLESVRLNLDGETNVVTGWVIKYSAKGDKAFIDKLTKDLTDLHKVNPFYDDYYGEDVWELENGKAVYVAIDSNDDIVSMEYTEFDESYYDDWWW